MTGVQTCALPISLFQKKVQMLVQRRIDSDYTQVPIGYSEANCAKSESEELKEILIELKKVL